MLRIFTAVVCVLGCTTVHSQALSGTDVLKRDGFKVLDGGKIAIITNQTGRDQSFCFVAPSSLAISLSS